MRRAAWIGVLVVALLSITATPSLAWRRAWSGGGHGGGHSSGGSWHGGHGHVHGRVVVGVSPWWGWGWGWPYYPYGGYYGPPYAYYPPPYPAPVVTQEQQTYAQTAPEPGPAAQPKAYWYYCASAGAYYPTAPTCPEVWIKVPPRSE